jgi:surface protein
MKKLLYILLGLSLVFGCSDDGDSDSNEPCPSQPTLETSAVTEIEIDEAADLSTATFNGEIINNPIGVNCETLSITSQGFVYAIHTLPTIDDESVSASGQNVNSIVSGLSVETVYYVRTYLTNPLGTFYGNEVSFETPESANPIYLDDNGVTIKARDWASVWMEGEIDGVTYLIVDREFLLESINSPVPNEGLNQFVTSKIENMSYLFQNKYFVSDLSNWDVSNVTDMSFMFNNSDSYSQTQESGGQDLSNWDVSSVTNMEYMFSTSQFGNSQLESWSELGSWDVSSVTTMREMFGGATFFDKDISSWDVSNVTDMSYMFYAVISFNQDISSWDVSSVTNMSNMFNTIASLFNQDLSSWDVDNVTECSAFVGGTEWTQPQPNFTNCDPD